MNVNIIRNTVAGGFPVFVGDVVDLPEQEAKCLIAIGKATAKIDPPVADATSPQIPADAGYLEGKVETADLKRPLETSVKKAKK
jgi:hypothetical protein